MKYLVIYDHYYREITGSYIQVQKYKRIKQRKGERWADCLNRYNIIPGHVVFVFDSNMRKIG